LLGAGHRSDYSAAAELIEGMKAQMLIADRGYDADWLITKAQQGLNKRLSLPVAEIIKSPEEIMIKSFTNKEIK
jgi:hypothetical protein